MKQHQEVEIYPSARIDRTRWDRCVRESPESLIYATTDYLNKMADNWHGLVVGDYRAVMPLPWRRKMMLRYYYHVPFVPQGGLFGTYTEGDYAGVAAAISRFIPRGDILLNFGNARFAELLGATPLVNLVIDLTRPYAETAERYQNIHKKNIRMAEKQRLEYMPADPQRTISLFKKQYAGKLPSLKESDYQHFRELCDHYEKQAMVIARQTCNEQGTVLATALFLLDEKRLYNMLNVVLPEGRKAAANHFLIDRMIREFSGKGLTLDMEGSDIRGIKTFFQNFGAVDQPYFLYRRFTGIIKMLKKK